MSNRTPAATDPPKRILAQINDFTRQVWGNPEALIRRPPTEDGVEIKFIDISDYLDPFKYFFQGIQIRERILIRSEYEIALGALQTDDYKNGVYVIGQPGIGKTFFLIYLLVSLLHLEQVVAVQLSDPLYMLLAGETVEYHPLGALEPLERFGMVWALCDSNADVLKPHYMFRGNPERVRVVQTTSPRADRWKEWSKQAGAVPYVMDIWTVQEIRRLAMLSGMHAEHIKRMVDLAKNYGGVPRTLLAFCKEDSQFIEDEYRWRISEAIQFSSQFISAGKALNCVDPPSPFFFIRPYLNSSGIADHRRRTVSVPTDNLCNLLGEALKEKDNETKLRFYNSLSLASETRQSAGFVYESWFHSFFLAKKAIECRWVGTNIPNLPTSLSGTDNLLRTNNLKPPTSFYWVAPPSFPGIDSAFVTTTEVFAFQITIASKHEGPKDGLQRLRRKFSDELKEHPFRLIYIGPEAGTIEAISQEIASSVSVPVGWSAVDPLQPGVKLQNLMEVNGDAEIMEVE